MDESLRSSSGAGGDESTQQWDHWGHLVPGEFRYIFAPKYELGELALEDEARGNSLSRESTTPRSSTTLEMELPDREAMARGSMFEAARASDALGKAQVMAEKGMSLLKRAGSAAASKTSSALIRTTKATFDEAKQRLGGVGETKRGGSSSESSSSEDESSDAESNGPETPRWARKCGFKLLLVGSVPVEGLELDLEKTRPLRREWTSDLVERVLRFLNPRSVARAVRLGRRWAKVGYSTPLYGDVLGVGAPIQYIPQAHAHRVDDVVVTNGGDILSAGDKRVLAFDAELGTFSTETAIRDTTDVVKLVVACGSLWSGSQNGCIREWSLPHDVRSIEFRAQLWDHNARINDIVDAVECPKFGGEKTSAAGANPRLVTCSDDRTVRVWNAVSKKCEAIIRPFNHRCATMRSLVISDKHLYVGASDGTVYVYSADSQTRRLANLRKKRLGVDAIFPLELELGCGAAVVSALAVTSSKGVYHDQLFVATWDGALRVWAVPKRNLDFHLLHTFEDHSDRITSLYLSRNHIVSASDDATLRFYGRYHGDHGLHRSLERVVHLGARVKCIALAGVGGDKLLQHQGGPENNTNNDTNSSATDYKHPPPGLLVVGTSDGALAVHAFGQAL